MSRHGYRVRPRGATGAKRNVARDLRGASRLIVEATGAVSAIVRDMQGPTFGIAGLVHQRLRDVTRLVGAGVDSGLAALAPALGEARPHPRMEATLAILNGVLGDHLAATGNPLAIPMELRRRGVALPLDRKGLARALPAATGRILVLVHGSCMDDLRWRRNGHDHGAALERDLGYTAVYVRYNSGLHVSTNGRALSALLERLLEHWPVRVTELSFLAHSMGGLVCRSACHEGARTGLRWPGRLRNVIFLGTPHHGAPAERVGNWVNVALRAAPFTGPLARLGQIRSAGVTDLRHGNILDRDWEGRDRFRPGPDPRTPVPLPRKVRCFTVAASRAAAPGTSRRGDGLVPLDSALGSHRDPAFDLRFPPARRWIAWGTGHIDLLGRPEVYERIRGWLGRR
jgi:hypothetical protein